MDLKDYLNQRRSSFSQLAESVTDYSVFDFNHLPENPLVRDEVHPIADALIRYEKTGIPSHLVIFGARGCGKTLTLRHLNRTLEQESGLQVLYANVRNYATSFKILAHLLSKKARGTSLSELYEAFQQRFGPRTVVVLDEVHLWAPKERQRELLYFLSRDPHNYMVIMLSNDPRFLSDLDPSVRSSLQPELIYFRNYDAAQVETILADRAQRGVRRPDLAAIAQISGLTVKETNSDVRVAIKALFYWATTGRSDVAACFENARRDIYVDLVADLSDTNLLILRAATTVGDKLAKKVYAAYTMLAEEQSERSCSYVHFYNQLSYLQSLGLVLMLSTKVNRTYANRVSVLVNADIVRQVFSMRFGE
jgi:archaeal cell division control protein 6